MTTRYDNSTDHAQKFEVPFVFLIIAGEGEREEWKSGFNELTGDCK